MAADVSSVVRILNRHMDDGTAANESDGEKSTALMTRDLLGVGEQSQELDLDLQVPTGWEKRLDLKSGKVYLKRCNSTSSHSPSSSSSVYMNQSNQTVSKLQDFDFLSLSSSSSSSSTVKSLLNASKGINLELQLSSSAPPSSSSSPSSRHFQSVCTLEKVKSALERAEKDSMLMIKKRPPPPSSSSSSSSSSSIKGDENGGTVTTLSPVAAAGCLGCLSYVLVTKSNPQCPRCNSFVPLPSMKKPKIDLNISI